jgi:transposase
MSQRELQRVGLLTGVLEGQVPLQEAAGLMGVCYRQAKRLKAVLVRAGPGGLAHGNRGRSPTNRIGAEVRAKVLALSREKYADFNDTHFAEMLAEREGIEVSRDWVRRVRRETGIGPKRRRRSQRHHRRRPRKEQAGAMMLWDGSPHRWFGEDRRPCCLMAAVDDATSRLLWGRFEQAETSLGYLRLLREVVDRHGIPASVYQDRHSALFRNDDHWSLEEQLRGEQDPTQVGRALQALGIVAIPALSPQAKGRVERLFGTLQDRLIAEMRLAGIETIEKANRWLSEVFIDRYNRRFSLKPASKRSLFRRPGRLDLEVALSFFYEAKVGHDNAVRIGGLVIDVPPGPGGRGYAKKRVEVRQLLDGSWRVMAEGKTIATHPPTELNAPTRARTRRRAKGAADWTWVYRASAPLDPAPTADGQTQTRGLFP